MNKISSTRIAIVFVVLIALVYYGYQFTAGRMIDAKRFAPLEPGRVTLLGIDAGANYKIIISNGIAQLVQVPPGKLESPDEMGGDDSDSSDKRHIPLKETIQSLQGNTAALGELVTIMNDDLRKVRDDIPPNPVVWQAADVQKAIDHDGKERNKLERDLNCKLDGTPTNYINVNGLYNGITIDLPVPVRVEVRGSPQTLVAHVRFPFRVGFTRVVEKDLSEDNSVSLNPSSDSIRGYYLKEAKPLMDGTYAKENVEHELSTQITDQVAKGYADAAEKVLSKTQVILNESLIKDASMNDSGSTASGHPLYDLDIDLTGEGRDRLWQYSRHRVGTQLLLIVDGVAIAAPYVRHELAQSSVTITQMADKSLVQEAIDDIKSASGSATGKQASLKQ